MNAISQVYKIKHKTNFCYSKDRYYYSPVHHQTCTNYPIFYVLLYSAQNQADHAIYARRAREDAHQQMSAHINNDYNLRHKAQWEAKTDNLIVAGRIRRRANEMQHVH